MKYHPNSPPNVNTQNEWMNSFYYFIERILTMQSRSSEPGSSGTQSYRYDNFSDFYEENQVWLKLSPYNTKKKLLCCFIKIYAELQIEQALKRDKYEEEGNWDLLSKILREVIFSNIDNLIVLIEKSHPGTWKKIDKFMLDNPLFQKEKARHQT